MTISGKQSRIGPWGLFLVAGRLLSVIVLAVALTGAVTKTSEARGAPESFADLAEQLSPSVVNISTAQNIEGNETGPDGSPLEDLFKDLYPRGRPDGPRQVQSLGSGFVISADGMVVTNNHVIEDADEITVNFPNGLSLKAVVIGTDPQTDIAVLKIEHDAPLPFVQFGDSTAARVGDWVLAIGNPFGFAGSVSAGIISARNRDINAGRYDDFIQTDAAINRGNSGGPLFNMDGEVIGVNTAIISPTGGSIGIGFSVPSNLAQKIVSQLQEFGVTRRGWLGVRIQSVNDEMAEALNLEEAKGALVAEVTPGGPAEAAGVEAGDVILKFDGKDVDEMRDLPRLVADTQVESAVRVVVFRKGKTQTLKVTIGLLEEDQLAAAATSGGDEGAEPEVEGTKLDAVGMVLRPLSDAAREEFGIADDVSGVLIGEVDPESQAAEKGVQIGDVIVEVGQEPVSTPAEVAARVSEASELERKSVLFLIQNKGDLRFVPLAIGG
ncbi:MAG: DegQ family serine endoprotease [Paracoccaceae bacterium]